MTSASIIKHRQKAPERATLTNPEIYSEHHKSIVVDSRYEDISKLLVHLEGSNWKVNYFSQVLDEHTAVTGHSPNKAGLYQQYIKIVGLVLKVDSAMQWSQNNETKQGVVTGSATIYPPTIPNQGDMFVADIGDGHAGIFQITVSEKHSLFKQAAYRVEYVLIDYADDERLVDLESKVLDTRYFELDFMKHGQNPVLLKEDKKLIDTLNHYYPKIASSYFEKYYSTRYHVMILPLSDYVIYDPFLTKCISHWFGVDDYVKLIHLKIPPLDNIKALSSHSIFDVLEDKDEFSLKDAFTRCGMISEKAYATHGRIPQIARIGLSSIVYPVDSRYSVDSRDMYQIRLELAPDALPSSPYPYTDIEYKDIKLLPRLDLNTSYVFTPEFYRDDVLHSHLEIEVRKYLNGDMIIKEIVFELVRKWHEYNPLEQFYYTPILLMLIRASIRAI